MRDLTFGCSICREVPAKRFNEFWSYFDKFHDPGIADRIQALTEHRYRDYAQQVAPRIAQSTQKLPDHG